MNYDTIIIGGGPSGLMAAIAASKHGARVLLLDKGNKLGRKLGISGGGRCNVTNAKQLDELIRHIPGNGRFLHSSFSHFNNHDIIRFFEELGIALKEEDDGRMFPVSDKAKTVVDALIHAVKRQGVDIRVDSPVQQVLYEQQQTAGVLCKDGTRLNAPAVILATGGKSVPHTGSTGDGFKWAEDAGHTITELFPTEVPLTSAEAWIQDKSLQGLALRGITLKVWNRKGKPIIEHAGDVLFTHFGLSGPAALRCSQYVVKTLKKEQTPTVLLTIDLFPGKSLEQLYQESLKMMEQENRKTIKNALKTLLPERIIPLLLKKSQLAEHITYDHIPKQQWRELCEKMKAFPVQINGTLSLEEAFVTGGGIHLKEVHPGTMESKIMPGLFFCGEILDIHGYTGGYNITAAFSTGYTAGMHAALQTAQEH
ncbi:BaiN/RdsA family NAD(P)/FAD-dependent oxidoreductase [Marinicrinis sediminis]|uniref:NAD(P)/FAD-dependent oxidoreductase n=1 Tax=Marinicrinis sediminis TaxID=1652465 RepID=A0ABW5RFX8_9BACL